MEEWGGGGGGGGHWSKSEGDGKQQCHGRFFCVDVHMLHVRRKEAGKMLSASGGSHLYGSLEELKHLLMVKVSLTTV
jgi:hypothetical protein